MIKKLNVVDKDKKKEPRKVAKTAAVETEKDPFEGLIEEVERVFPGLREMFDDD